MKKPFASFFLSFNASFLYSQVMFAITASEGLKELLFEITRQLACQGNANGAEMDGIFRRLVKIRIVPSWV